MSDFKDMKINKDILKSLEFVNPIDRASQMMKGHEDSIVAFQRGMEKKEQEELRRHNEMVESLKEAAKNGATIIVGDNANQVQILQNSEGASQEMMNSETFDYEKTLSVLNEIKECFDYPRFKDDFGANTEAVQEIVNQTIDAVNNKKDPKLITKSLNVLYDLAIGVSGSIIATGIIGLLSSIM